MEWLNYHHLQYFWMVAKHGSITRASAELRLAHPTISGQTFDLRARRSTLGLDHAPLIRMRASDETLRGLTVMSADGQAIGTLRSLIINVGDWHVESIQVELRKEIADEIGTRRTVFRHGVLELPVRLIQSVADVVILSAALPELREAQTHPAADSVVH
jgi:sporulation protein YlmC with PRC-barrel domain